MGDARNNHLFDGGVVTQQHLILDHRHDRAEFTLGGQVKILLCALPQRKTQTGQRHQIHRQDQCKHRTQDIGCQAVAGGAHLR